MSRTFTSTEAFPTQAQEPLRDAQLRTNLRNATTTIRRKRAQVVGELPDWQALRDRGAALKDHSLANLDALLAELEHNVTERGGVVHWAQTAADANAIVTALVKETGESSVVKIKSMTTAEIELNTALENAGIDSYETDLAELIVQLGDDLPSHILVPAIHRNRSQIKEIFTTSMGRSGLAAPAELTDDPVALASAARAHLRNRFFSARVAVSGANFLVAETGSLVIVESEGNGRMCLTLPETLISVVGIDKVIPDWQSLETFLQLLPRSSTGERMNPYTSIFTGVTQGDGPQNFHLVLLDNGRSQALSDRVGRDVLRCIRCSACLNVCPVYERTGGHAYGSPYPGPIGAVLVPQLRRGRRSPLERSLPYASTLCGACYEVCPVKIDIPKILVHLRSEVVDDTRNVHPLNPELLAMSAVRSVMASPARFHSARRIAASGSQFARRFSLRRLPPPLNAWTDSRDLPISTETSFREWFRSTHPESVDQTSPLPRSGTTSPTDSGGFFRIARRASRSFLAARIRDLRGAHTDTANVTSPTVTIASAPSASTASSPKASQGRTAILASIQQSLSALSVNDNQTTYDTLPDLSSSSLPPIRRSGTLSTQARMDQLIDRLEDYKATVWTVTDDAPLPQIVREIVETLNVATLVIPGDLDRTWIAAVNSEILSDLEEIPRDRLESASATLSACALAISETGTIVLDGGIGQGRRILSLLPDHLIVVVHGDQICEVVPEAVSLLTPTRPQTWISGPSATSDIELIRVEGVHGPRRLDVIIVPPTQ